MSFQWRWRYQPPKQTFGWGVDSGSTTIAPHTTAGALSYPVLSHMLHNQDDYTLLPSILDYDFIALKLAYSTDMVLLQPMLSTYSDKQNTYAILKKNNYRPIWLWVLHENWWNINNELTSNRILYGGGGNQVFRKPEDESEDRRLKDTTKYRDLTLQCGQLRRQLPVIPPQNNIGLIITSI